MFLYDAGEWMDACQRYNFGTMLWILCSAISSEETLSVNDQIDWLYILISILSNPISIQLTMCHFTCREISTQLKCSFLKATRQWFKWSIKDVYQLWNMWAKLTELISTGRLNVGGIVNPFCSCVLGLLIKWRTVGQKFHVRWVNAMYCYNIGHLNNPRNTFRWKVLLSK